MKKQTRKQRVKELRDIFQMCNEIPVEDKDVLNHLVVFFEKISVFQDAGYLKMQNWLQETVFITGRNEQLKILNKHVQNCGRTETGMNRTKTGGIVAIDNVYLGGVWGLFTKTVEFWLNCDDLESVRVIASHARNFMQHHAKAVKICDFILT